MAATASATPAPISCAVRKGQTSWGRIPNNVSVSARAVLTAELAKDVDTVTQSAPAMNIPTAAPVCAGSSPPQCAVTGCLGQTRNASPAALSQTVMTKSNSVAFGAANSSRFLRCAASVYIPCCSRNAIASGLTLPLKKLRVLTARNRPFAVLLKMLSAIMLRAGLPVHNNKTFIVFSTRLLFPAATFGDP